MTARQTTESSFHHRSDDDDLALVPPSLLCTPLCQRLVRAHPLWSHPFLERCRDRRLSIDDVIVLGVQMYKFSREFPRYLASILRACPDVEAQRVIADNLWDGLGRGDPTRAHLALFRSFTRSVGIEDHVLEAMEPEPETTDLIDTYLEMPDSRGYVAALGAICYASEGIVSSLYEILQAGISGSLALPPDALQFFVLHIEIDDGHKEKLQRVLLDHVRSHDDMRVVASAMLEALDARCRFLDGVMRRAQEL